MAKQISLVPARNELFENFAGETGVKCAENGSRQTTSTAIFASVRPGDMGNRTYLRHR